MTALSIDAALKLYRVTIEADVWVITPSREAAEQILDSDDALDVLLDDVRSNALVMAQEVDDADVHEFPWRADGAEDAPDATVAAWAKHTAEMLKREEDTAKQVLLPGVL